jgi:HAD superfamily hydrolase (TIGR01459 family)
VLHNGVQPYPGVIAALEQLRRLGTRTVLLSNAPARASVIAERLSRLGIARELYGGIVTSGEEVWQNLKSGADPFYAALGRNCLWLGPERHAAMRDGLDLNLVGAIEEASFILNTGPDDLDETASLYAGMIAAGVARDVPMVCANADLVVMEGERIIYCAGQLANVYAAAGGRVRSHGKPIDSVYRLAMAELGLDDRRRILAIGDNLHTDIVGAAHFGVDSALVACGIHAKALGFTETPPVFDLARLDPLVAGGIAPTWFLPGLYW